MRMVNKEMNKEKFLRNLQAGEMTANSEVVLKTTGSGLCGKLASNGVPGPTLHPPNQMLRTKSPQSVTRSSKLGPGRMKCASHWSTEASHLKRSLDSILLYGESSVLRQDWWGLGATFSGTHRVQVLAHCFLMARGTIDRSFFSHLLYT